MSSLLDIIQDIKTVKSQVQDPKQIREVLPPEKWLSPYYIGDFYYSLYDYWKPVLCDIINNKSTEVVLGGSLGGGKSTCGELLVMRKFYELSCFENIPAIFGLPPTSQLVFMYLSISVKQSERTGFGRLIRLIDDSPYMREHFPRDTSIQSSIKFHNTTQVACYSGSDISHFISCLVGESRVSTNQGLIKIRDLCSGKSTTGILVATRNELSGVVEYKPIIKAVRSGLADTCAVYCNSRNKLEGTLNHPVATPSGYVPLGDLNVGDPVYKLSYGLTQHQEDLVRGSLLGDSYLKKRSKRARKTSLVIMQCEPQKRYFDLKCRVLTPLLVKRSERFIKSKFENASKVYEAWTYSSLKLASIYDELYTQGKKRVTREYLDKLSDRAVFYWFMDEGSVYRYRTKAGKERYSITFHTQGFSLEETIIIKDWFVGRYSVPAEVERFKQYNLIRIHVSDESEVFLRRLSSWGYEGCLEYKLIEPSFRELDDCTGLVYSYELDYVTKVVKRLNSYKSSVFNLVVEGNSNYVANEYLVHNTDLYGVILDEANFLRGGGGDTGKFNKAIGIYRESTNRRKGRFTYKGEEFGVSIIISSADTENSFTESRIKAGVGNSKFFHKNTSILDVKRDDFDDEEFYVFPGEDSFDPFVLCEENKDLVDAFYKARGVPGEEWTYNKPPELVQNFFKPVPVNFRDTFNTDVVNSLKEVLGLSVRKMMRLYYSNFNWEHCLDRTRKHPFKARNFVVSTSDPRNELIEMFLPDEITFSRDHTYFAHIDQSINGDATGISLVHPELDRLRRIERVVIDFMLQITTPREVSSEIDISKVRDFYLYLKDKYKIHIGKVTYDQFASRESLQHFRKKNIEAELLSVDRTDEQYVEMTHLLNKLQISMYDYPIFKDEFFNLVHYVGKRKVDHEDGKTKDLSDSIVGAVWNSITSLDIVGKNAAKRDNISIFLSANSKQVHEANYDFNARMKQVMEQRRVTHG